MNGLVVVVTGGASGLGLACIKRFGRLGARVIACDLATSKGQDLVDNWKNNSASITSRSLPVKSSFDDHASQLTAEKMVKKVLASSLDPNGSGESPLKPTFFPADVTNEEQIQQMFEQVKKQYGKLDVLINCAGIGIATRTYNMNKKTMHGLKEFQRVLNINVAGTFNTIRWACHTMADNPLDAQGQRGVIINTASVAAYDGQIGQVAYAASKGAIVSMTLPLARDLSNMGIRVCTIAPGVFHTPMVESLPEKVRTILGNMVPFPSRLGQPDDFAHLAQAIVQNPYLNGEIIRIDGALRMPP